MSNFQALLSQKFPSYRCSERSSSRLESPTKTGCFNNPSCLTVILWKNLTITRRSQTDWKVPWATGLRIFDGKVTLSRMNTLITMDSALGLLTHFKSASHHLRLWRPATTRALLIYEKDNLRFTSSPQNVNVLGGVLIISTRLGIPSIFALWVYSIFFID